MNDLIVIAYDEPGKADEAQMEMLRLQKQHLVDLEDLAIILKTTNGKVKLKQTYDLTATGALTGGFWGFLIGMIFLNPLVGTAVGAAAGALSGSSTDIGIDDDFMRSVGATLKPNSSALCMLIRHATTDRVIEAMRKYGGQIIRTSLSKQQEEHIIKLATQPSQQDLHDPKSSVQSASIM